MAYEVNNLISPYNGLVYIDVWFSQKDYEADKNSNFTTQHYGQGSGVLVGNRQVLTASHVVYDMINQRTPYRIEVTPAYDRQSDTNPAVNEAPYGSFIGTSVAYNKNVDPDHNGYFLPGDGNAATLGGSELDVAMISLSHLGSQTLPTPFRLGSSFTQGTLRQTGYPASQNGNPYEVSSTLNKDPVDNVFLTQGTTLGPGASGGPAWDYVNGVPTDFGVVSSTGAVTDLTPHLNWIKQYVQLDVDNLVGSAANDIFHPIKDEFLIGQQPGFQMQPTFQYFEQGQDFIPYFWNSNIDGGAGTDTIALPWNSATSAVSNPLLASYLGPTLYDWELRYSKSSAGIISGTVQIGSQEFSFENVERVAFSDKIIDLSTSVMGQKYQIGTADSYTVVTSLDTTSRNPVTYRTQSIADDDNSNVVPGSDGDDDLYGFGGDDQMRPGLGYDTVDGGTGTDTLFVDYSNATAGIHFAPSGAGSVDGFKGTIADGASDQVNFDNIEIFHITTGSGADTFVGGNGPDYFAGGAGNDLYIVNNSADTIVEAINSGIDRIATSVSYTLSADQSIELLTPISYGTTTNINLTGNSRAQAITGNAGANIISDGGAGSNDTMSGLGGNDLYIVHNTGDVVKEAVNGGTDRVATSVNFTLGVGQSIEALTPTSYSTTNSLHLMGNSLAQAITGNAGANLIDGKAGNDTLTGMGGKDLFLFDTALSASTNVDRITDFQVGTDTIELSHAIFSALSTGALPGGAFYTGTGAHEADDRITYNSVTGALGYDSNGDAAGGATQFATLAKGLHLTAASFRVTA